ncbi:MAG: hypothetical protein ACXVEI_12385 [Actinomycetota bacterium]
MNDLRSDLARARDLAPNPTLDLDALHRRRARVGRRKRAGALTVSLAIMIALIGGMVSLARGRTNAGTYGVGDGSNVAGPTVDLSLAQGQYYYLRIDGEFASWWATDGSGQMTDLGYGTSGTFAPGGFVSDSGPVAYLSTDPTELEAQLRARVQPGGASPEPYQDWGYSPAPAQEGPMTWGLVRSIGELLTAPDVSPAQKAALFRVAAGLGGMDVTEAVTDPTGRPATRLSIETEGALHEWWFDAASEQLLAMRDTPQTGSAGAPMIVEAAGVTGTPGSTELVRTFVAAGSQP